MKEDGGGLSAELKRGIRSVPDFPKKGIMFRDLTTLWKDPVLMKKAMDAIYEHYKDKRVDAVVGIEARGFVFGALLAEKFDVGFVAARKLGKLPAAKVTQKYKLEYSEDGLEMHKDSLARGERVLIVDDLIATAGTARAVVTMVEMLGGVVVGLAFIAELTFLHGRDKLKGYDVFSLVTYDSEAQ